MSGRGGHGKTISGHVSSPGGTSDHRQGRGLGLRPPTSHALEERSSGSGIRITPAKFPTTHFSFKWGQSELSGIKVNPGAITLWIVHPYHQAPVMVTDALRNEQLVEMPTAAGIFRSVIEEIKHRLLPP